MHDTNLRVQIDDILERLTSRLIAELKPIAKRRYAKNVFLLVFEVELQEFSHCFPVTWYAVDNENAEVDLGIQPNLLSDIPSFVPAELLDEDEYVDSEVEPWDVAYVALTEWFSRCWISAGGEKCRTRAVMAMHDGGEYFDLNLGEVVSDAEICGPSDYDNLPPVPKPEEADFVRAKAPKIFAERVGRAFQDKDISALNALLREGWNVNHGPYREDMSLLELSAFYDSWDSHVDLAKFLIENGAGIGSALAIAQRRFAFDGASPQMLELLTKYAESLK